MPQKKPVTLCEIEREQEVEDDYSQAVSRVSRAIPIMATLTERLARKDAIVTRLPTSPKLFQPPTVFFRDNFSGSVFEWLTSNPSEAEGYCCSFYTLTQN